MHIPNLRQIFLTFLIAMISVSFALPVLAADDSLVQCGRDGNMCSWGDLYTLIDTVIDFLIFKFAMPVITIVLLVAGVQLAWKKDSASYSAAKSNMTTALWGLVIMLTAYLIVKAVIYGLTEGGDYYELRTILKQ